MPATVWRLRRALDATTARPARRYRHCGRGPLAASLDRLASRDILFRSFLAELSGARPTLVVFEDVHWADEATLDLLRFLGRRLDQTRALLLAT